MNAKIILTLVILLLPLSSLPAAELQLRARCQPQGAVVKLGDVAEVTAANPREADALAAIELFPAPTAGQPRVLRVRELQDFLVVRQVNLLQHHISGSSEIIIEGHGDPARPQEKRPSATTGRRAERQAADAIVRYLRARASANEPWTVAVRLDERQSRAIPADGKKISVQGGEKPWVGKQRFEFTIDSPTAPARFSVDAEVSLMPMVVVATASLARGAILHESDVRLQAPGADTPADAFHTMEEVLGKEALRALPSGAVLQPQWLHTPILVHRGEVVTVYARSSGIRIRTTARAKEDGSQGDLVTVESLPGKRQYSARVSGVQEVEVYARAVEVAGREQREAQ